MTTYYRRDGTQLYGIPFQVSSQANLPQNALGGQTCYTADLNTLWVFDDVLNIWIPANGRIPFVYDVAAKGGVYGDIALDQFVPSGLLITNSKIDVITAFTEGAGTSSTTTTTTTGSYNTLAIKVQTAADVFAATAIQSLTPGGIIGAVTSTAATWIKTTAKRTITVTIAGTAQLTLLTGKLYGWLTVEPDQTA